MADTKQKKKINQNTIIIILSLMIIGIVYFAISIVRLFQKPVDTVLIKNGELINYEEVVGYIIRNEDIIDNSDYDGLIKSEVPDATRVAKDSTIITYVSKSEEQILAKMAELDEKINKAIESQQTIFPNDVKTLENEIENAIYSNIKDNRSINSLKENKKYINEKIEKKAKIVGELSPAGSELKNLIDQRRGYETELNNAEKTLTSPKSGLISYRVDNLENVLTYNSISLLTIDNLKKLKATLNEVIPVNTKNVKVIDNFECYIAVPMSSEDAFNAKLNDTVYLRFKNTKDALIQATIEYISNEDDEVLLVFKIGSNIEELSKYRKIGLDVVWWSSKGLKASKDVLFYSDVPYSLSGDNDEVTTTDNSGDNVSGDIISGDNISGDNDILNIENLSGDSGEQSTITNTIKIPTITIKKAYYTVNVFVKVVKETEDFVILTNYTDNELREMGVLENVIEGRSTLKLYDEALVIKK